MIIGYLKVALRNFLRYRSYTLINVLGLAAGLASCLLIGLFVGHELSYDGHYANADRIYRVSQENTDPTTGYTFRWSWVAAPVAELLLQDFPQIEQAARLTTVNDLVLDREGVSSYERQLRFVDAALFELFDFEWLLGDPSTALAGPASVVLTKSLAEKYFGAEDPLGRTLTLNSRLPVQVTGVIADLPDNTHLSASGFASVQLPKMLSENNGRNAHTYLLLKPGTGVEGIKRELPAFKERHFPDSEDSVMHLSALQDIHWMQDMVDGLKAPGNLGLITSLTAVGICILAVACINFVNLSTARSSQRALEVGVRKSLGAVRSQLIRQFLGESLCLTILAMLIALAVVEVLVPAVNSLLGRELAVGCLRDPWAMLGLIGAASLLGVLAGAYPAFSLSSFSPVKVLKGGLMCGGGRRVRQALVVLQFSIAIALGIATAVIHAQMNYARSIDLGLDKEQILVLSGSRSEGLGDQWSAMKQELLAHPQVASVTSSHFTPFASDGDIPTSLFPVLQQRGADVDAQLVKYMAVDYDFFETYGIELLVGRAFSEGRSDRLVLSREQDGTEGSFIINEMMARQLGWSPEEAVGQMLWLNLGFELRYPIVGVAENTHFQSLTRPLEPLLFFIAPPGIPFGARSLPLAAIRLRGNNLEGALAHIDAVWREFLPELPLDRHFLNQDFEALYQSEEQQRRMVSWFTGLAIFIACLGLYGLASFNAERRTQEIGVRKVMGGSVWSIVLLLTNDFSKLVLLANLIAWPAAYFAMSRWLENFAYRIDLTPLIFVGSGLIALCIAWLTVGGTAAKAASAKPVLALRYE